MLECAFFRPQFGFLSTSQIWNEEEQALCERFV